MADERKKTQPNIPIVPAQQIGVKEAVAIATDFVQRVYDNRVTDILLEEVDRADDGKYWLIISRETASEPDGSVDELVMKELEDV